MKKNTIILAATILGTSLSFSSNFEGQIEYNKRHLKATSGIQGFSDSVSSLENQEILKLENQTDKDLCVTVNLSVTDFSGAFDKSQSITLSPNASQVLYRRDLGSEFCTKGNRYDDVILQNISSVMIRFGGMHFIDRKDVALGGTYTINEDLLSQLK